MKENKTKDKTPKKGAPVDTKTESLRKQAEERKLSRLEKKLQKIGLSNEEIENIKKNLDYKTVTVIPYGNLKIELGTRIVTRGKKKTKIEVPHILTGVDAIEHLAKEAGFETIARIGSHWVHIKIKNEDVDKALEVFGPNGRVYIYNWQIGAGIAKAVKNKKPTNNTSDVREKAKKRRKSANKKNAEMRPYYAALRKGGVSARIKRHNKTLADKIEAWLKEHRKKEAEKAEANKEYRKKHKQLTTAERKKAQKAKKVAKQIETKKAVKVRETEKAKKNQQKKKPQKSVEQELKMAALLWDIIV